jgi:hypothetical protein
MNPRHLILATAVGLALQLAMVVCGHYVEAVKALFAPLGVAISLFAGWLYAARARADWGGSLLGGTIAGGVCALLGIAVSFALGDVPAMILALGTISSAVGGLIGGGFGRLLQRRASAA